MTRGEYSPQDPQFAAIHVAHKFFGRSFSFDSVGFVTALAALREQHQATLPTTDAAVLREVVLGNSPVIQAAEAMGTIALERSDYELALMTANHLFAYGDADYRGSLGGEVLGRALIAHRALGEHIRTRFGQEDVYLRRAGEQVFREADVLRSKGEQYPELRLVRSLVHTVAFNGTLGEAARKQFDPFAIFTVT